MFVGLLLTVTFGLWVGWLFDRKIKWLIASGSLLLFLAFICSTFFFKFVTFDYENTV